MNPTGLRILPVYSEECLDPDYQIGEMRLLKHQVETLEAFRLTVTNDLCYDRENSTSFEEVGMVVRNCNTSKAFALLLSRKVSPKTPHIPNKNRVSCKVHMLQCL